MTDELTYKNARNAEETDRGSETDYMSVPAGPSRMARRGEGRDGPRPGPASFKARYQTRSRSGSASSVSSTLSNASTDIMDERRNRREAAQEANRLAIQMGREQIGGSPIISVDSDESDEEAGSRSREKKPPRKRKLSGGSDTSAEEDSKRKQGRPQTTGLYVGRAKAQEELNRLKKEAAELDNERIIRSMSSGKVFAKIEADLDDAMEEMSDAPTADIAHQARESMVGVMRVAKCSKKLQGGFVKILKHAAVIGSASTEVLRTRADNSSGTDNDDALRQLKALRKELEQVKLEARRAREEAEKAKKEAEQLRKELTKVKGEGRTRERRRVYTKDSSPSPPQSPNRRQVGSSAGQAESTVAPVTQTEESPMEVEITTGEAAQEKPPEYSDERRKKEILPPPEEWPPAIRPALQGKVKVLEDIPLVGHKVHLVNDKTKKKKVKSSPVTEVAKEEEKGGAQLLLEQITPLLQKWLEGYLESTGLSKKPSGRDAAAVNAKRQNGADTKTSQRAGTKASQSQKAEKPTRPTTMGPDGAGTRAVTSTTVPNKALWSEAVGRRVDRTARPPTLDVQKQSEDKSSAAGPFNAAKLGAWQVVAKGKKKANKTAGPDTRADARREKEGPPGGKPSKKGGKGKGATPPSRGTPQDRVPKRRPPRTAAVTLTCPSGSYAEAMRTAQKAIDLKELGINELRPKRAATGAIVLEVPGPNGAERASILKERMEEALRDMEGVRVAHPVKMADLRVKDLLASTTAEEAREAISSVGGCTLQETRAGEVRMAPNGLGTLWVQCPLSAAKRVVAAGRLRMGWTSSRVEILEPRQLRCFRCLERGHVQNACPSPIDRSKLCYRCSQEGHAAKLCANDPFCVLCKDLGLASGHRMGGKSCRAPKRNPKFPKKAQSTSEERMEVEISPPAVRGGSSIVGGTTAPVRRGKDESGQPAVRGESSQFGGAPVPVRLTRSERSEDKMEVEAIPELPKPPLGQRTPRVFRGTEEPGGGPSSSPRGE